MSIPCIHNPTIGDIERILQKDALFVVSFSNFMDETTAMADLVLPVSLPMEAWDEYGGKLGIVSTLQPAMGKFRNRVLIGDVFLKAAFDNNSPEDSYKAYLIADLISKKRIGKEMEWLQTLQNGGIFKTTEEQGGPLPFSGPTTLDPSFLSKVQQPVVDGLTCIAAPSIRFFDGRGANRPWLCEVPDPITRVAWQTPVLVNPRTLASEGLKQGDLVQIVSSWGQVEAPIYETNSVVPGALAIGIGQGHKEFGRYAAGKGVNPFRLTPPEPVEDTGGPQFLVSGVRIQKTGRTIKLAHTDGSRKAFDRKIAVTVPVDALDNLKKARKTGLTMWDFPLTLPLPEGYDSKRDFYPSIHYEAYRWSMVVDLDRCIGCGACAAACYAENNIGIVDEERILQGREMAWLSVERYEEAHHPDRITFLPLMCQHCDNAPCESVCPVYAPHHTKEGMNNQIYNRCIGTRFCSQNCPYKVRRFNWFTWEWPEPFRTSSTPM